MWIRSVPYLWIESVEPYVRIYLLSSLPFSTEYVSDTIWFVIGFCRFYFDFGLTYVGAGMICSHLVNLSLLLGAVLSHGIMWPLISRLKGQWFSESLKESDMKSLYGYKVSLSLSQNIPIDFCYPWSSIYSVISWFAGFHIRCSNPR
jgi:hypothetical protein